MCRTVPRPFWSRIQSSYSPDSSEKYAIDLPSGDHAGSRSATAGLFVRLRPRQGPDRGHHPRASAGRRHAKILDTLGIDLGEVRTDRGEIALYADVDVMRLVTLQVVKLDGTELLDHNRVRSGRRGFEIESVALKRLSHLLRFGVIGEETDWAIAIRKKVDRVSDPHRMVIVVVWPP